MPRALSLLLPLLFATSTAFAEEPQRFSNDPPSRVGRVSVIEGRVSMRVAGQEKWAEAEMNYPIVADMEFVTDAGTRTEFQLGATTVSVGGRTAVSVVALDDDSTHLFVDEGSIDLRVHALSRSEHLIIETPDGSAVIQDAGIYRVDTSDRANPMRVVAFDGSVDVQTSRGRQSVGSQQALDVNSEGRVHETRADATALDEWAQGREDAIGAGPAAEYVSSDVPGSEDLDRAGTWQTTKEYGAVWIPTKVAANWAPYQDGHWSWVLPWGWTWIDNAAWGFAPFHYGRWVNFEGHWAWTPGKRLRHPVFAPALVGFDGIDPSSFASKRQPPRRWVALGPNEIYRAPYNQDLAYLRKVNKGAVTNDQLATATWDTDEWPTFVNVGHVHLSSFSLPAKALGTQPPVLHAAIAPEGSEPAVGAKATTANAADEPPPVDAEGHMQMVLRIPMDQARRMNLVPADAYDTLHPPPMPEWSNPPAHELQAEHGKALPENLNHPELADRSGLIDPLPEGDAPARPPIHEEKLEALHPTPGQPSQSPGSKSSESKSSESKSSAAPLSWPVHQDAARKHDASATSTTKPHVQTQASAKPHKDDAKATAPSAAAQDGSTED